MVNEGIIGQDNTLPTYSKVGTDTLQSPNAEANEENKMMDLLKELAKQQTQNLQNAANHSVQEKLQVLEISLQMSFL
jgi:hypothetical protein